MFNLSNAEWMNMLKGAAVAAVGAVLTYATQAVAGIDFGPNTPMVVAAFSIVANYLRKVLVQIVTPDVPPAPPAA
jgi:hypothetical protein